MPTSETNIERQIAMTEAPESGEITEIVSELRKQIEDLQTENAELRELAMKDSKTGLWNDRGLREMAGFLVKEHIRDSKPLSVLVLDIDNFKELNSRFGNPAVDRMMIELGKALIAITRGSDVVARHGGDEFVIVFTADQEQIVKKFLEIESGVSRVKLPDQQIKGEQVEISFSGGIANFDLTKKDHAFDDALEKAFQAQLKAKQDKGRIEKFQE